MEDDGERRLQILRATLNEGAIVLDTVKQISLANIDIVRDSVTFKENLHSYFDLPSTLLIIQSSPRLQEDQMWQRSSCQNLPIHQIDADSS